MPVCWDLHSVLNTTLMKVTVSLAQRAAMVNGYQAGRPGTRSRL